MQKAAPHIRVEVGYLVEIHGSFHSLALTKEKFLIIVTFRIVEPKIEQFACNSGGTRITIVAPFFHLLAHSVDKGGVWVVAIIKI